ncbi:MAG: hypothetical protein KAQ83_04420 [Nanoarchaeota archaeon]|nr:hypothetical protein [Nanoarchaeota archaeon]
MSKLNNSFFILSPLLLIGLTLININYSLIILIPLISAYLIINNKLNYFLGLWLAFLVSLIWNILARSQYNYNQNFFSFFGINLFPLVTWTIGLFALMIIYQIWIKKLKLKKFILNLLIVILIYSILLIFLETLFYHVFNVHNLQTAIYPGLPVCNCLHAPGWMQLSYFLIGPIYFVLFYFFQKK